MAVAKYQDIQQAQRQVIARPIAEVGSSRAGLEGLSTAFGNFFNTLADTSQRMAEIGFKQQQMEIKQRHQYAEAMDKIHAHEAGVMRDDDFKPTTQAGQIELAQTQSQVRIGDSEKAKSEAEASSKASREAQAISDAAVGNEVPAHMKRDVVYMTAYSKQLGTKAGEDAANKFDDLLKNAGADANPQALHDQFIKTEFGQGPEGQFAPFWSGAALSTFEKRAASSIDTWRQNRAKTVYNQSLITLSDNVSNRVATGSFTADDLQDALMQSTALHKGEEVKARPYIMGVVLGAANTPEALANIESILTKPNSGVNGKSFMESFPAEWASLQDKITKQYLERTTLRAQAQYAKIDDMLRNEPPAGDTFESLGQIRSELERTRQIQGGEAGYNERVNKLVTRENKLFTERAEINQLVNGIESGTGAPKHLIDKHQEKVLKLQGIEDPLADPATAVKAANIWRASGGMATTYENGISFAMSDPSNPRMQNAFIALRTLEGLGGSLPPMSDTARQNYRALSEEANISANAPSVLITKLQSTPNGGKGADRVMKHSELLGMSETKETEAREKSKQMIYDSAAQQFGVKAKNLRMDPQVEDALLSSFVRAGGHYKAMGVSDPGKTAAAYIVKDLPVKFMPVPAANGTIRLSRNDLPEKDSKGQPIIAPGVVRNPVSGEVENTVDTYKKDIENFADTYRQIIPDLDKVALSIPRGTVSGADGVFDLTKDGDAIYLTPGQTFLRRTVGGDIPVSVPKDPAQIQLFLPDGFQVISQDTGHGVAYRIGYRFHYKKAKTLEEKAAEWTPPTSEDPIIPGY